MGRTVQAGPMGSTVQLEDPAVELAGLVTSTAIGALKNDCPDPHRASTGWALGTVIC